MTKMVTLMLWKGVADRRSALDEGISVGDHESDKRFPDNL